MFKAARNRLVEKKMVTKNDAPSYFIECLLYNVPDNLFAPKLAPTYAGIVDWLRKEELKDFDCQNGRVDLFGSGKEQWSVKKARAFVRALQALWGGEIGNGCRPVALKMRTRKCLHCNLSRHSSAVQRDLGIAIVLCREGPGCYPLASIKLKV